MHLVYILTPENVSLWQSFWLLLFGLAVDYVVLCIDVRKAGVKNDVSYSDS